MDCGIDCLIKEYKKVQKISTDILIDIFFNIGVIRFLFSGLVFSISQNSREVALRSLTHRQGYATASKLLNFLLLFTKGKEEYVEEIVSNGALNTLVGALKKEECADGSTSSLCRYKLRVLQLLQVLQVSHHGRFDRNLLDYLLPLLHNQYPLVISYDIKLMWFLPASFIRSSSLIENDSSQRILIAALNNNIILTIQSLTNNRSSQNADVRLLAVSHCRRRSISSSRSASAVWCLPRSASCCTNGSEKRSAATT